LLLLLLSASCLLGASRKPNIVVILADDLGWMDTSIYGSSFFETPNIDALARRGLRFTDAYAAAPVCSPARAGILTGLHPARIGMTKPRGHVAEEILAASALTRGPQNRPALETVSVTRLKLEYETLAETLRAAGYRTGHFGKWHLGPEPHDPLRQGFDVDVPHTSAQGATGGYLGPWKFWPGHGTSEEHIEDRMAEEASRFMRESRDHPFLLNYWSFSVHTPLGGRQALIDRFRAKADPGNPQRNPVMGAMVASLDAAVGKLLRTIDELGIAQETIVVFTSDNGGMVHLVTEGSATTSNLPLRSGKSSIYEGGVRVPLIVVWPGRTRPGSVSGEIVHGIDLYPTLVAMAGIQERSEALDGISIVRALESGSLDREAIFIHHPHYAPATAQKPSTSVRKDVWKLIRFYADGPGQRDRFELYNLREDIGEGNDLSAVNPEKVKELRRLIERFLEESGAAIPMPNPRYREGLDPFPDGAESKAVECTRCS
jgi:arylsulfatase A-like enzyme